MNSRLSVLQNAWPIIIANAATPLLGLVDTAVIGQLGSTQALGALAISNLVFNFLYWAFGFLRMSTTGFVSQAYGANDSNAIAIHCARAIFLGAIAGVFLIILQFFLIKSALTLFQASEQVEALAQSYFQIRIWGAPATLITFAISGLLIGLGKSRHLLLLQGSLNALNILLDIIFAGYLNWGVEGIAFGTLITEVIVCTGALFLVFKQRPKNLSFALLLRSSFQSTQLIIAVKSHRDIFLRTLFLLLSFAFFTNQGAAFGDTTLAANHIMLQFISFSAFFLDGFAFVAEAQVGRALGKRSHLALTKAIRYTSEWAVASAIILALALLMFSNLLVSLLTDISKVQEIALALVPLTSLYILLSVAAFQLDGIFIGATQAKAMRNASIASFAGFVTSWYAIGQFYGNAGLWACFILYVVLRAATLMLNWKHIAKQTVSLS